MYDFFKACENSQKFLGHSGNFRTLQKYFGPLWTPLRSLGPQRTPLDISSFIRISLLSSKTMYPSIMKISVTLESLGYQTLLHPLLRAHMISKRFWVPSDLKTILDLLEHYRNQQDLIWASYFHLGLLQDLQELTLDPLIISLNLRNSWRLLETIRDYWGLTETSKDSKTLSGTFRDSQKLLQTPGDYWKLPETTRDSETLSKTSRDYWRLPRLPDTNRVSKRLSKPS